MNAHVDDAASKAPPAAATIQPYLFFRGRCQEAIDYYKETLGAEVVMLRHFKDNPEKPGPDKAPTAFDNRIMHASLRIFGSEILVSDGMKQGPSDFQCMSLSINVQSEAEVDRIVNALAAEGVVQMAPRKTFFGARFGSVADKFGLTWMVIAANPA